MHNNVELEAGGNTVEQPLDGRANIGVSQWPDNAGFTLVEMLVVLILTAVMAAMMVGGIRQMQTWTQLEKRQSVQSALEAIADHISGELSGALPLPLLERDNDEFTPMIGAADSIRFVAVIRTGFLAKALRETSYTTELAQTGKILVRKSKPHRFPRQADAPQVQSEELFRGVAGLTFSYLVRDDGNAMTWLDAWTKQTRLPIAVRITISQMVDRHKLNTSRTVLLTN